MKNIKTKENGKLFRIINEFKKILLEKPSFSQMFDEVKMMGFKIHPINGDVVHLIHEKDQLVEILWMLGKLDEFLQTKFKKISSRQKQLFIKTLYEIFGQFKDLLKVINVQKERLSSNSSILELEVYKDYPLRKVN